MPGPAPQQELPQRRFRRRARQIQKSMLAAGGVRRATDIAEEALSTRRPVRSKARTACRPSPETGAASAASSVGSHVWT
jgi:hypothetical protein